MIILCLRIKIKYPLYVNNKKIEIWIADEDKDACVKTWQ